MLGWCMCWYRTREKVLIPPARHLVTELPLCRKRLILTGRMLLGIAEPRLATVPSKSILPTVRFDLSLPSSPYFAS